MPLTVPGPTVITTTRSARAIASSRSCVTKMTDGRVCSHSASSSFDMIAFVWTSSAPNGSSIRRIDGSLISAAARQLVRVVVLEAGKPDAAQPIARIGLRLLLGHAVEDRAHGDVGEHGLP